jgi:3-amino-4-hydroxybenzoic acid synthase
MFAKEDNVNQVDREKTPKALPLREQLKNERFLGESAEAESGADYALWYDARTLKDPRDADEIFFRVTQGDYSGVFLDVEQMQIFLPLVPKRLTRIIQVQDDKDLAKVEAARESGLIEEGIKLTIASTHESILKKVREDNLKTCLSAFVTDAESLHRSIKEGRHHAYLMIQFKDPTNIPLELVIASLQASGTVLIKNVSDPEDFEDALVCLGVMEIGADGVMFSPHQHQTLDKFLRQVRAKKQEVLALEPATVMQSKAIGMGYRSCIDLPTIFSETEGMIVGSTSQGGVLCCPEVFYLPYMELRPFRINAGGIHSYVYNSENRTDYMTELKVGREVMIVDLEGKTRKALVGRLKTELRPLRLIEAQFADGEAINILLQDDWHVRVFSPEGKPLNCTELVIGSKILAYKAKPGRHVGIKIDENILET